MTNIVLNKYNYKFALKILQFLIEDAQYPLQHVLYSIVAPEGIADIYYQDLVFDLYDFQSDIHEISQYCKHNNINLRFF